MNIELALNNLKDLSLCLNRSGVEYWLSCGTLLGVIRDGSLITHDTDVDICVNVDYLNGQLIRDIKGFGFNIIRHYGLISDGFEIRLERFGEKLDIFFFYKKDTWYHSVFHSNVKYDYVYKPFSLTKIEFDNFLYPIPDPADYVLEQQYGPNWRVVDKNWSYWSSPYNLRTSGIKIYKSDSEKDYKKLLSSI